MTPILLAGVVVFGGPTIYFAWRSRDVRKFLAGAFFVSGGMQFYFYIIDVSMPLLGTSIVQTPGLSGVRAIVHLCLFLICFYSGFVSTPADGTRQSKA
jgi:uncharacterized protein (DUF486 family)